MKGHKESLSLREKDNSKRRLERERKGAGSDRGRG